MKRNMALVHSLLFAIESGEEIPQNDYNDYHLQLMCDEGLVRFDQIMASWNRDRGSKWSGKYLSSTISLTWKGHDYIDGIKENVIE